MVKRTLLPINEILPGSAPQLGFKRFTPRPELAALVECFWLTGNVGAHRQQFNEKLYPDGGSSLTIEIEANGARAALSCNKHTAIQQFSTHCLTISARFKPGALFRLFGLPATEVPQQYCDASLLLSATINRSLQALLLQLPQLGALQAVLAFEHWILQHNTGKPLHANVKLALQQLCQGHATVSSIAADAGISRRTLERQMQLHTGFNPAYFKHCLQIKQARQLLCQQHATLADIAVLSGFYDQAHFSHAFNDFVGETPAQYRNRKLSQSYNTAL